MPTRRFAEGTTVPIEKSKSEIERLLYAHGASGTLMAWDGEAKLSIVQFRMEGRVIKMTVPDPEPSDYALSPGKQRRSKDQQKSAAKREHMRRWRALLLVIKAKLELIEGGGSTAEREFMADLLLPDGSTLGEHISPKLEAAYQSGKMPQRLLPG